MNLPISPADHVYLAHVEEQARIHETLAGQYRDIAAMIRKTFQFSTLSPAPSPQAVAREATQLTHDAIGRAGRPLTPLPDQAAVDDEHFDAIDAEGDDATPAALPASRKSKQYGKTLEREAEIKAILAHSGPLRVGQIHKKLTGVMSDNSVKRNVKSLLAKKEIIATGSRSGMRYQMPNAAPVEIPPVVAEPVDAVDTSLLEEPATATEGATEKQRARIAFLLMERNILGHEPKHLGDIILDLSARLNGPAPYDYVKDVLAELVGRGEVQTILKGKETHYMRPALRARKLIKERLMGQRFDGPGQQSRSALLDFARLVPGANAGEVDAALTELIREQKIQVRTIGDARFYSRRLA